MLVRMIALCSISCSSSLVPIRCTARKKTHKIHAKDLEACVSVSKTSTFIKLHLPAFWCHTDLKTEKLRLGSQSTYVIGHIIYYLNQTVLQTECKILVISFQFSSFRSKCSVCVGLRNFACVLTAYLKTKTTRREYTT